MSALIRTDRGIECVICQAAFTQEEQKWTHVGGEAHDGFHMGCLVIWLGKKPTCPVDRKLIDLKSVDKLPIGSAPRALWGERIKMYVRQVFIPPFYAVSFGLLTLMAGAKVAEITLAGLALAARMKAEVEAEPVTSLVTSLLGAGVSVLLVGQKNAAPRDLAHGGVLAAGTAAILLTRPDPLPVKIVMAGAVAVSALVVDTLVGVGMARTFERSSLQPIVCRRIEWGITAGVLAGAAMHWLNPSARNPSLLIGFAVASSCATGIIPRL